MHLLRLSLLLAVCLMPQVAFGGLVVYSVALSGPAESPANSSPGTGTGTITFDDVLNTMRVQVSFSNLLGNVTNSHIHARTATPFSGTAGVATQLPTFTGFPAGGTSGTYDNTFDMSLAASFNGAYVTANGGTPGTAFSALMQDALNGQAYLNIHSSQFGGGEIRGFLTAVPEPSSLLMLSMVAVPAYTLRRRRA
ncbi:MAG: CHRD domain-containing protein [Planctomycetales bacterium]|nr:CHRD domain-containing protein [Planctomycetales bacterium]